VERPLTDAARPPYAPTYREGIHELYSRYAFAMDASAADELADCFTEDGVFWVSGMDRFVGRERIRSLVRATVEKRPRHQYVNLWIKDVSDDGRAHCRAYFHLLDGETGENAAHGTYEDWAVLCPDGAWRWRERRVQFEWTSARYAAIGRATTEPLPVPAE
jgi:uncharacterized protein (TIGR02246 family)